MLKRYIKDIIKTELTKQKLNDIYGSARSYNLNSVSDKERQQLNEEISILKNHNNNIIERNKSLRLKLSQEKNKYDELLKYADESYKKQSERINELEQQLEAKALKNGNLQFNTYGDKYVINTLQNENEKLKKENKILQKSYNFINDNTVIDLESKVRSKERIATEINIMLNKEKQKVDDLKKELCDSKNGLNGANDIIKNMKQENEKLKDTLNEIHEICFSTWGAPLPYCEVRSLLNKIREVSKNALKGENMKKENEKLEDKLSKISNVVSLYNTNEITFMSLMSTIDNIRNILKES